MGTPGLGTNEQLMRPPGVQNGPCRWPTAVREGAFARARRGPSDAPYLRKFCRGG